MKEYILQEIVLNDIQHNMIYDKIINKNFPYRRSYKEDFFNYFISDRYRCGVINILVSLRGDLQLINIDTQNRIKSISLDNNNLYPDILAVSNLTGDYLIIELKTNDKTERETLTELYSYEQELINHLPMLERGNIHKIIIATTYKSMLRHSVSNALLHGDNILCLRPKLAGEEVITYEIVDVCEWTMVNYNISDDLSKGIFNGISLSFYKELSSDIFVNEEAVIQDMKFSIDMLKDFEGTAGGNGFCIIWKAHMMDNKIDVTTTDYVISLFSINPYYISIKDICNRKDTLSKFVYNNVCRRDQLEDGGQEYKKTFEIVKDCFRRKYSIIWETPGNLYETICYFNNRIIVDVCSWGELGRVLKELYCSKPYFWENNLAFNNPDVFFKLIVLLTEDYSFRRLKGKGEAFHLGVYIGILDKIYKTETLTIIELNEIRHVWKYVFCSISKIFPSLVNSMPVVVEINSVHKMIKSIEKFRKKMEKKYSVFNRELITGMKLFYFSSELREYRIVKSFLNSNAISFCDEELIKDTSNIEILFRKFSSTYSICVSRFIQNPLFRSKSLDIIRDIILLCRATDDSLNIEEDVLYFLTENQSIEYLYRMHGYDMMLYLRKMLNLI